MAEPYGLARTRLRRGRSARPCDLAELPLGQGWHLDRVGRTGPQTASGSKSGRDYALNLDAALADKGVHAGNLVIGGLMSAATSTDW